MVGTQGLYRDAIPSIEVGFTVGVWDCWHEGHVNFLERAQCYCDHLVVGIMNDYWVQVQKGHDRPYDSLPVRLLNLRNSGLASKIVILDTLDMTPYLQMSDVWIKGEDQKNMRPFEWPNEVFVERTHGVSTTDSIERLRNGEAARTTTES